MVRVISAKAQPPGSAPGRLSDHHPAKKTKLSDSRSQPNPAPVGLESIIPGRGGDRRKIPAAVTNGVKPSRRKDNVEETQTTVGSGAADVDMEEVDEDDDDDDSDDGSEDSEEEEVETSSGEDSDEARESEDESESAEDDGESSAESEEEQQNGDDGSSAEAADALIRPDDLATLSNPKKPAGSAAEDTEEPTFGDLLLAHNPDPIDVEASLAAFPSHDPAAATSSASASAPSKLPSAPQRTPAPTATTLTTVLAQALRTNDPALLNSCLSLPDLGLSGIRLTVSRLPSPLASVLLQRLAERMHASPGRAGPLMVWVQWCLVAHGGYLAAQPDVRKRLRGLSGVLKRRADGLGPLLGLKGRLDMLTAQVALRREEEEGGGVGRTVRVGEEGEGTTVYVEGEEEIVGGDDDEEEEERAGEAMEVDRVEETQLGGYAVSPAAKKGRKKESAKLGEEASEEDMPDTMPNGVNGESEEEDGEMDSEDELIDDEAEETENDTGMDDEEEDDDDDEEDEEDEEDVDGDDEVDVGDSAANEDEEKEMLGHSRPSKRSRLVAVEV